MTDHSTSRTLDEVPEADLVEQSVPAYPEDPAYAEDTADDGVESDLAAAVDRDAFSADPADVVEQSIAVPLDDDHEPGPGY
ncbi:hypothetical protein OG874_30950 [Nocardia sp. NBC_00565]|uniref:hypothetical protein n=1 Tax=Nocardia sp. NBC_00565 TaxID=2975993 RepID=UPI002E8043F4|nr:hypothetical protein [Nocardia sp. NBC_00565]WUC01202.1 hypothetical protein OG874_30950 [Nocardia sp. NBC_00565]